jgi:hypothetical protein
LCHPDTGFFVGSGTVKDNSSAFGKEANPGIEIVRVYPKSPFYLLVAGIPMAVRTDVQDQGTGVTDTCLKFRYTHHFCAAGYGHQVPEDSDCYGCKNDNQTFAKNS